MRHLLLALACLGLVSVSTPAFSQGRGSGLISSDVAHRHGLTSAWQTSLQVNRSIGRVAHITQQVSEWMYVEVKVGDLAYRYSERDRDASGMLIGRTGAAELADAKRKDLEEHHLKPTVTTQVLADVRLYVVTDRGILQAIDGETGETLWSQQIGLSNYYTSAAGANDLYVAICNGSHIYMLDRRTGDVLWTRRARYTVSGGPAVTKDVVAVPTLNGAVESYRVNQDRLHVPHIYRSQGKVFMQPVATDRSIAWATESGHMYVADGLSGKVRFRLEASDTIVGQPAYLAPRYIYAASVDGYLYCCDELNGQMLWRYSTGGTISKGAVAVGEAVYVVTDEGELHAVDYKSGLLQEVKSAEELAAGPAKPATKQVSLSQKRRWPVVTGITSVVSVSPTRIYCQGRNGQLVIVDRNSGNITGTMSIGMQDLVLHNQVTDRLILGTSTGTLQCLHEAKLVQPYVHEVEAEKLKSTRPAVIVDAGGDALEKPMAEPMDNDPFGGGAKPAADDPFGAPAPAPMENDPFGAPAPKKEAKPATDDPFG